MKAFYRQLHKLMVLCTIVPDTLLLPAFFLFKYLNSLSAQHHAGYRRGSHTGEEKMAET